MAHGVSLRNGLRFALIVGFCALTWSFAAASIGAPPHTISAPDHHPYDPDWPDVYLIVSRKCVGCHRAETERQDYSSYEALLAAGHEDGMPVVVPGDVDESMLWQYVLWNVHADAASDEPDQPQMPPEQSEWLTAGQLATIRRWIERGAQQYRLPDFCEDRMVTEIDFPSAKQCAACHPKEYGEWSRSMHAYAQHSPVFEAFNLTLVERTGGTIGTFCTRCHTPIGTALGENGSRRNVNRSRISTEGITCVVCHRRSTRRYKSSGRVTVEPGRLLEACMFGPFETGESAAVGAHPSAHLAYIRSSQFCGECHDVTSPQGVRLEEAFSEWQNSPAARQGVTCQHCHMGPVQGVPIPIEQRPLGRIAHVPGVDPGRLPLRRLADHTFAGPDYSLLPDTEFPEKLDWMYEVDYRDPTRLTPHQQRTLIQLRRQNRASLRIADAKRYELLQNAARIHVAHPPAAECGERLHVRVDVQNKVAGHSFPTGFTAERQLWVSVELRDPAGRLVYASGDVDNNADLRDDHSHAVLTGKIPHDRQLLNFQNKFVALGNKGTETSVVLSVNRNLTPLSFLRPAAGISSSYGRPLTFRIAKGSLPPLTTLGRNYAIGLPAAPGMYRLSVRLNFRHLPPALLDHIGTPHLKHLLEVVVIDQYDVSIPVGLSAVLDHP